MATGHLEKRSKHGWTLVIDHGRYVDPATKTERQRREYRAVKNCTKAAALALLHDTLAEINRGTYVNPSPLTLAEYLRQWYEERCRPRLSPSTLQNYLVCIDKHLIPTLGDRRLDSLQPLDLQRTYASMLSEGAHPRTVEQVHQVLHIALRQAVRWMMLPRNVADFVDPPHPPRREMTALSPEEVARLIETAGDSYMADLIALAVHSGMRRGELLGLGWQHIDLGTGVVHVERTLQKIDGRFIVKEPKTPKSRRGIPLDAEAKAILCRLRERQLGELVFCKHDGAPRDPSRVTHDFAQIAKRAGFRMRFHDLRHTYASLALLAGVPMRVVQELMGHEDALTTANTYSHVLQTLKQDAARAIGDALESGKRRMSDETVLRNPAEKKDSGL